MRSDYPTDHLAMTDAFFKLGNMFGAGETFCMLSEYFPVMVFSSTGEKLPYHAELAFVAGMEIYKAHL